MRTEKEIRESLAVMEKMALDAARGMENETVRGNPFLLKQFELWKHRSAARANILKWVLELPYLNDEPPALPFRNEKQ